MVRTREPGRKLIGGGEDRFTEDQIAFLQSEFDRQRKLIGSLTERENEALLELERAKGSVSYRIGRVITSPLRMAARLLGRGKAAREIVSNDELVEIFPELEISPEFVPNSPDEIRSASLSQKILISLRESKLSANEIRDLLRSQCKEMGKQESFISVVSLSKHILRNRGYRTYGKSFYVGALRFLVLTDELRALEYYDEFSRVIEDNRADKTIVALMAKIGEVRKPYNIVAKMNDDAWSKDMMARLEPPLGLIERGFGGEVFFEKDWASSKGRVMYCASQTLPHTSNGYAVRTHEITKSIGSHGKDVIVCARHGYPLDRSDFRGSYDDHECSVDGVEYRFNPSSSESGVPEIDYNDVFHFNRFSDYQEVYSETLARQMKIYKPEILHAASNFVVGMASVNVAKAMGIPSVYEIRGFWHVTRASKTPGYEYSDHYNLSESMELEVAERADHVFTITQAIADILVEYGISPEKISVLPNSVNIDNYSPMERDRALEEKYELFDKVVVGYVGSFVEYEGLDLLLEAIADIRDKVGEYLRVLLVGDGPIMEDLLELSQQLGVADLVTFTGRVPNDEVKRYYSLIDIAPFPRKGRRVCELVSPLKPFEAMAMQKAIVASSVQALEEIVEDGVTGLIHSKDDGKELGECIMKLVLDDMLRDELASNARAWVRENRTWEMAGSRVTDVYSTLV